MSPMEDLGGTAIQSYGADIQRVKGKRRKAILIKNHAVGLLVGQFSAVSLGTPSVLQEEFIPIETCSLLLFDVYVRVGDTHFHLVCEPPCEPDLAPCLGPRQTLRRMTDRERIHTHNDNEYGKGM